MMGFKDFMDDEDLLNVIKRDTVIEKNRSSHRLPIDITIHNGYNSIGQRYNNITLNSKLFFSL